MNLELRSCRADEMPDYGRILAYVFAENDRENIDRELDATEPGWTHCAFVDGRLVATMGVLPFTVQLNGRPASMGGVTGVGTLPEWRRKGLLRQVMTSGLAKMRDEGQSMAILWASMGAIYQRFGYGLAASMVRYEFDPRYARFEKSLPAEGRVEMVPAETARPLLEAIYNRFIEPRNLPIHRTGFLWESALRQKPGSPKYVAVYTTTDAGEPRGYIVYKTRDGSGLIASQELQVIDFIPLDTGAFRALWDYILRHDLVSKVTMGGVIPEDDPAPDLLSEPRILNRRTMDAIWLRITDVASALAQRPYAAPGKLTFAISGDEQCPWNEGTWTLETDGPAATISRTTEPPGLSMPINTLAGLLTGFRTASHYRRIGLLESSDPAAVAMADRLFATDYRPFTPNEF
jgi:predicted acetyltransferase